MLLDFFLPLFHAKLVNWVLIDWLFMVLHTCMSHLWLENFHAYWDVTIDSEGLQNLGLCSTLTAFKQRGIFIVPQLLLHWASFFRFHPKDRPIQSPPPTRKGMFKTYSNLDPHMSPFSCLLPSYDKQGAKGDAEDLFLRGSILTQTLIGHLGFKTTLFLS
jgi:hypothetical protein